MKDKSVPEFWEKGLGGSVILEKDSKKYLIISYGDVVDTLKKYIFDKLNIDDFYCVVCCSHATKGKSVFDFFHKYLSCLNLEKTEIIPIFKNILSNLENDKLENDQTAELVIKNL